MLHARHGIARRVRVDEERRDPALRAPFGIGHSEHEREVRVGAAGDEVLAPSDRPDAVFALRGARLDPGCVRAGAGLGEGEARDLVRRHERVEVLLPLGFSAVHVDGVRPAHDREDALDLREDRARARSLLVQEHLAEEREPSPSELLGHMDRVEPELGGAFAELQDLLADGGERPALLDLLTVRVLDRKHLPLDELAERRANLEELVGDVQERHDAVTSVDPKATHR